MATQIDSWVKEFTTRRGAADGSVEANPDLVRLTGELDGAYWREVERLLVQAARENADRIVFSPDQRLLLDLGLLDYRLLPGGDKNHPDLLREIYLPGQSNQFYFSEWAAQRFRQFALYGGMSQEEGSTLSASRIIRDMRSRLYIRLTPLLKNLPGFSQQHIDLFLNGRIDETLYAMDLRLEKKPDNQLAEQRLQLQGIRTRMITRARERARTDEELALFDALRELDRQSALKRGPKPQSTAAPRVLSPQEREGFMAGELRFLRSVLWLGVMGSGLARTHSVLVTLQPRITKPDIAPVLEQVRLSDPTLPDVSSILIAPYVGGGFYEWDRDTVFLPLIPTRSLEDAIVSAMAKYRMLLDRFQEGGKLMREYELALGGEDFHTAFVRDYRNWILGIGKGFKGALDPARFNFFKTYIGPQAANLYASRSWSGLTPDERIEAVKQSRGRIARAEATFDDHYRLAVSHACNQQTAPAISELNSALKLNPVDGRALLALGQLSARTGGTDIARRKLQECMALAGGTIWSVFAADELHKL